MSNTLMILLIVAFLLQFGCFVSMYVVFRTMQHVFNEVLKCASVAADELAPELPEEDPK